MLSRRHYSPGKKAVSITNSECVSIALFIQHAKLQRHIILPPMACPPLPNFISLSQKRNNFLKRVREYEMCVLIFCTTFAWNISHSKKNWARCNKKNVYWSSCKKIPGFFLPNCCQNWIFWTDFSENPQISNSTKICPVGAKRTFRWTWEANSSGCKCLRTRLRTVLGW